MTDIESVRVNREFYRYNTIANYDKRATRACTCNVCTYCSCMMRSLRFILKRQEREESRERGKGISEK